MEWAKTWVHGGTIPIKPASTYLNDQRDSIYTPDENLIHDSDIDIPSYRKYGIHIEDCKDITITNCIFNGQLIPDVYNASYYKEDGLILSFCNKKSNKICKGLNKKACVKIINIEELKQKLDLQLGCEGEMRACEYTQDHQRNHFLKSTEDAWQDEFRIFWRIPEERNVSIDKGTAKLIKACKHNKV